MKKSPLLIIFLVVFIDLVGFGIVIPILPYYAKQFGATASQLGWLMTSYSALQFFFAPIWGRLSDRIGRRPVLLLSMLGTVSSMVLLGLAPSLTWLFIGRIFAGISGANISTATAYIADVTTPENRAKGMGLVGAAFGLGFIFGPAIGGVLSHYGYSIPMLFAAALGLVNWCFAFARLKEPPITEELREKNRIKRFDRQAFRDVMGDRRTKLAILVFFIVTVGITQMEVSFALYMQARYQYNAQGAGWMLAYMGIIMTAIQGGLIGKLSKKFGETALITTGVFLMAIGLVGFAFSPSISALLIAMTILSLGHGVVNPSLSSLASKGSAPEKRGATMGVYHSAGSLARVVGPPVAGWAYDVYGMKTPFFMASGLMLMALIFFSGANYFSNQIQWVKDATRVFKEGGFRGLLKTYGWKLVACFVAYYLIRDISLYILLPWMAARGVLSFRH